MKLISIFLLLFGWLCIAEDKVLVDDRGRNVSILNRQSREWQFPSVDPAKGRVVVSFRHRIDFPKPAGWCPCWQIEVNGKVLTAMATRSESRLLNKPYEMKHRHHGRFVADNRSDKWYSLYLPDFGTADGFFVPATKEASRIALDISDAVSSTETNSIIIRCHVPRGPYTVNGVTDRKPGIVVGNFEVRQESENTRIPRRAAKKIRATLEAPPEPKFSVDRGGDGFYVALGGKVMRVNSVFSLPGGGEALIGASDVLDMPCFSVRRRMNVLKNRIDVFDTFESKTNVLIGVKIRHETESSPFDPVYVAGDSSPSAEEFEGGRNPTVFGALPEGRGGIAFVAQDDVFRVQSKQYCKDGTMGIRTDGLALEPGKSRTIEWSIYPTASSDYFDFVNDVRRDWDVNFPIDGVFTFSLNNYASYSKERAVRNKLYESIKIQTLPAHFWVHLKDKKYKKYKDNIWGMGKNAPKVRARISATEYEEIDPTPMNEFEKLCIRKCREFTPDTKVLTYIHNQICSDVDDAKYEDCRMIDSRGLPMFYTTMKNGGTSKIFVPQTGNMYGRDFIELVDWNFRTFDIDGLYLDEANHCNSRIYYGDKMWDGVSVELDENNNVRRKISYVCLLKLDFTLKFFDNVLNERNKILVANFSPETRSERKFKFPRFEETYSSRWIALSHLYTPIQLGDMLTYSNTPKDMAADQRTALMRGALYYHYVGNTGCPSLTSKMYPFTPIELHKGWLVGEERILTAVSGEFGWRGKKHLAQLHVFDALGREVQDYPAEVVKRGKGTATVLELEKDHCAALVKIPVDAEISGGVRLSGIRFADGCFSCVAEGQGEARFNSSFFGSKTVRVSGRTDVKMLQERKQDKK